MVTSRDVALRAGVSQATVSRVLTGAGTVSATTRDRVTEAIDALGYHPHRGAAAMKTSRSGAIGVIVAELENPFYLEVLVALAEVFAQAGHRMIMWDSSHAADAAVAAIRDRTVDGVVIAAWREDSAAMRASLDSGRPVVMVNRRPAGSGFDSVTSDNRAGGALVADYLVAHGRLDTVLVAGREGTSTADDRAAGFRARMAEAAAPAPAVVAGDFSYGTTCARVADHVRTHGAPAAVFCANDLMAIAALNTLASLGVDVPGETWVVGFDDVVMSGWPLIGLTTVSQHSGEMAREGARMLLERIGSGGGAWRHRTFPARLVVRRSTAHAPTAESGQADTLGA